MLGVWEEVAEMPDRDTKLKPCPFCGSEAELYSYQSNKDFLCSKLYGVFCKNCICKTDVSSVEKIAIENWNRRVVAE